MRMQTTALARLEGQYSIRYLNHMDPEESTRLPGTRVTEQGNDLNILATETLKTALALGLLTLDTAGIAELPELTYSPPSARHVYPVASGACRIAYRSSPSPPSPTPVFATLPVLPPPPTLTLPRKIKAHQALAYTPSGTHMAAAIEARCCSPPGCSDIVESSNSSSCCQHDRPRLHPLPHALIASRRSNMARRPLTTRQPTAQLLSGNSGDAGALNLALGGPALPTADL
ncbi:hypothetical protein FB45DRAFT_1067512 [Roridomyces roridus]|uniref:Uncharacterized protein n=1 Tax=Roridomyces roridus TaxID=1738132 RepID=A0AAD7B319_9AGAR|nr:hypothetical protein FB45DRAFT_1067512 [Roridomyces roridus]